MHIIVVELLQDEELSVMFTSCAESTQACQLSKITAELVSYTLCSAEYVTTANSIQSGSQTHGKQRPYTSSFNFHVVKYLNNRMLELMLEMTSLTPQTFLIVKNLRHRETIF